MVTARSSRAVQSYIRKVSKKAAELLVGRRGPPEGLARRAFREAHGVRHVNNDTRSPERDFRACPLRLTYENDEDAIGEPTTRSTASTLS